MPTGYTADVQSGKVTEFKDYALQCARAFGALILMRDDPADAPIPDEFPPSTYNRDALKAAEARSHELSVMTVAQLEAAAQQDYKERLSSWRKRNAERNDQRNRYEAMLAKAKAFKAPTANHVEYRAFMIKQLEESIDFDCSASHDDEPKPLTATEYLERESKSVAWSIEYSAKEWAAEQKRAADRTAWVKALKASLTP